MSNAYYRLYVDSVFLMAKTLVIKSDISAEAINRGLIETLVPVDESNPRTWKYYLNLNGQYHHTDRKMVITSLDTLEEIEFTKENLLIHAATKRQYTYGTRFYNELVNRFPDQELLIKGVLNPVDIDKAIKAYNGEILFIEPSLIESNEENLIEELQKRINAYFVRWSIDPYAYIDDLYPAAQLAILYLNIPKFILNIRLENCHTEYVHSFHVRQYLASNGRLDSEIDFMTKKQMLFFYRNIRYIHRNAGKVDTFNWLTQNVLTDRGLPLAEYEMRHNLTQMPEQLKPGIDLEREGLNDIYSPKTINFVTVEQMLEKQIPLAKDNVKVLNEEIELATSKMTNTVLSKVKTKVLESSILDRSESDPNPLIDVLLNYWIYLGCNNRYSAFIFVDNPRTGEQLQLTPKDAFILYLYAYNKARGIELPYIPTIWANHVRKNRVPTVVELRDITQNPYVSNYVMQFVLENAPTVNDVISVTAFYDQCVTLHQALQNHRLVWSTQENHHARGQVEVLARHLYQTVECNLADEISYDTWFDLKTLEVANFTQAEYEILAFDLLQEATGLSGNQSRTLKEIQSSMLRLMTQLSSYSVHYLQDINTGPVTVIDWSAIRLGDDEIFVRDKTQVDLLNFRLKKVNKKGKGFIKQGAVLKSVYWDYTGKQKHSVDVSSNLEWMGNAKTSLQSKGLIPMIGFKQPKHIPTNLDALITIKDIDDYQYPE